MAADRAQLTRYSSTDADDVIVVQTPLMRAIARVEPGVQQASVELIGELDLAGVAQIDLVLRRAERSGMPIVLVDLSGVHFVDLPGVRVLLAADERVTRRGHRLVLLRPPREVAAVFAITGADEQLTFLD